MLVSSSSSSSSRRRRKVPMHGRCPPLALLETKACLQLQASRNRSRSEQASRSHSNSSSTMRSRNRSQRWPTILPVLLRQWPWRLRLMLARLPST